MQLVRNVETHLQPALHALLDDAEVGAGEFDLLAERVALLLGLRLRRAQVGDEMREQARAPRSGLISCSRRTVASLLNRKCGSIWPRRAPSRASMA